MTDITEYLTCPVCAGGVMYVDNEYRCQTCGAFCGAVHNGYVGTLIDGPTGKETGVTARMFRDARGSDRYYLWLRCKTKLQDLLRVRDPPMHLEDLVAGKSVLDVGCGPGIEVPTLERADVSSSFYLGVDYSGPFLSHASLLHQDSRHVYVRASATRLPFASSSFDVVCALFTLHHVEGDSNAPIAELARTSRGDVFIADHVRSEQRLKGLFQTLYWRIFDGGINYLTMNEWESLFANHDLVIKEQQVSGLIFRHVVKFHLQRSL